MRTNLFVKFVKFGFKYQPYPRMIRGSVVRLQCLLIVIWKLDGKGYEGIEFDVFQVLDDVWYKWSGSLIELNKNERLGRRQFFARCFVDKPWSCCGCGELGVLEQIVYWGVNYQWVLLYPQIVNTMSENLPMKSLVSVIPEYLMRTYFAPFNVDTMTPTLSAQCQYHDAMTAMAYFQLVSPSLPHLRTLPRFESQWMPRIHTINWNRETTSIRAFWTPESHQHGQPSHPARKEHQPMAQLAVCASGCRKLRVF